MIGLDGFAASIPTTLPAHLFAEVLSMLGAEHAALPDRWGRVRWPHGACASEAVAEARCASLLRWRRDTGELTWLARQARADLPPPEDPREVAEIAVGAGERVEAEAVYSHVRGGEHTYFAVHDLRTSPYECERDRSQRALRVVAGRMDRLGLRLRGSLPWDEGTEWRGWSDALSDLGRFCRALRTCLQPDAATAHTLGRTASQLDAWSVRVMMPMDEPIVVAAELVAEASQWR
jgi:hypothetical protein